MSTVNNDSLLLPRIIERTHLKLILRSPGLLLPRPESFVAVLFGAMSFFCREMHFFCQLILLGIGCLVSHFGYHFGYLSDISFECHREKSMQVNCLIQDSRLFNLIQLAPKYFNNIKEAKLGSDEVTESTEGDSSTHIEYYLRLMDNDDRLSDSIFRSTDSNRIESIKHQINSFINSQQSSLDDLFTTNELQRTLIITDFLLVLPFFFGVPFLALWLCWKMDELHNRIFSHYFVFDKYARKLDHTVKIFNWSLRSQCYPLSDITEVCLTKNITGTEKGKFSSNYTLRLLLNSYKRSGSKKNILLVKTDFWSNTSTE